MLYFIFYHLLKLTGKFYFKGMEIHNPAKLNSQNPLIIVANHGNSFMDAILMAIIFKRKLHFLARADAFDTPFKRWFLSKINMMPVYRIRDGRAVLKNNDVIFGKCQQILNKNGAILIFPEGNCVVEKRLRTFKTGFIQLAFYAESKNLEVLPVTINYTDPQQFYSEVSFYIGSPILVDEIKEKKRGDYIAFSKEMLEKVKEQILDKMVVIPDPADDLFYERVLTLGRSEERKAMDSVNLLHHLKKNDARRYQELKHKVDEYFKTIASHGISDEVVKQTMVFKKLKFNFLVWPIYELGLLMNYPPLGFINGKTRKLVKEKQFLGAVKLVLSLFTYLIYLPMLVVLFGFLIDNYVLAFLIIILSVLTPYFYFHQFSLYQQQKTLMSLKRKDEERYDDIMKLRACLKFIQ